MVALGLRHCVRVLSCSSSPHVTAVVRVIYGCQEVPRSPQGPQKYLTGGGGSGGVAGGVGGGVTATKCPRVFLVSKGYGKVPS